MKNKLAVIILAAGKGKRMKSDLPKVLHKVCGRPMLGYVLDLAKSTGAQKTVVVLGHQHEQVRKYIPADIKIVKQGKLLGTADAVKKGIRALGSFKGDLLILYGDMPLLKKETLDNLIKFHVKSESDVTLLTAEVKKPDGYGRILRDKYLGISGIVEDNDADEFQKDIKEINTGVAVFKTEYLSRALRQVKRNSRKGEYYLTDVFGIIYSSGGLLADLKLSDMDEAQGVNSRADLASVNKTMRIRINEQLMQSGVTMVDPGSVFIDYGVKIGKDSVIYPFTVIENGVKIGKRCSVGPFAHLRDNVVIEDDVLVGNFLEIVRSRISSKVFAKHFGYIGDSRLGKEVNIGAGVVTANFNGKDKNLTIIKDKAFVGSDTVLVAPVKVGRSAVVGAGTVVLRNKNIPDRAIAVGVPSRIIKR